MFDSNQTPTFNLKAVVRETGLKPDTLRAWERRYGMPQPKRTGGGHRLYSQKDIDTLKWLVARQNEGLSISRAVEMWRQFEAEGQDPLRAIAPTPAAGVVTPAPGGDALKELRQAWVSAGLAFDERKSEQALSQAFALYPVDTVCFEVLQKGMAAVGEGWHRGEITVQQEHFISELAIRRLEALVATSPSPVRPGRVLVGCPPEEEHIFSPLLLTLLLRRKGWEVVYLGANVPTMRIEATINSTRPHLAVMTAQHLSTAATLLEMSRVFQENKVPLAFGGLIFNRVPALRAQIPGYFLGERLEQAPAQIEQWLIAASPLPPIMAAKGPTETYRQTLAHYQEQRGMIEAQVWQAAGQAGQLKQHLPYVNSYLGRYITAALTLGDMNFLNEDVVWLEELLSHHFLPVELLYHYLRLYRQAAQTHLDERGAPIVAWLAQITEK